jgi:hypothetical protein
VNSYPPAVIAEAWKTGYGLWDAAWRLAPPELRSQLQAEFKLEFDPAKVPAQPVSPDAGFWETLASAFVALKPALDPWIEHGERREAARTQIRDRVLKFLAERQLIGIGFALPRRPADTPAEIPSDVWAGKVDWENSAVSGNGLNFVSVRLVTSAMLSKTVRQIAPPVTPQGRVGRPSIKKFAIEAYDALKFAGAIDYSKPMTVCFDQVRRWLEKSYPDRAGFFVNAAEETLRQHVGPLFQQDRRSQSQ